MKKRKYFERNRFGRKTNFKKPSIFKMALVSAIISSFVASPVMALPNGATVANGTATVHVNGNTMTINNTNGTIINWNGFSIGSGETVNINQLSSDSAILNRVVGDNLSQIMGQLNSNGQVFLINPNGILFGSSGSINTAAFFASTHRLSDQNFLNNNFLFEDPKNNGAIVNLGNISATGGDVFLIANSVRNEGTISAPNGTVGLAAAKGADVLLADGEDRRILIKTGASTEVSDEGVVNAGSVEAAKVELAARGGNVYALAIHNDGDIRARTIQEVGGRIMLLADDGDIKLGSQSNIDASGKNGGGEVYIGGNREGKGPLPNARNVTTEAGSAVKADATEKGDGGKIILFAENDASIDSYLSATGGLLGGDGGFIETSGKQTWEFDGWLTKVDVSATNGENGSFLIDPATVTISGSSGGAPSGSPSTDEGTLRDTDIINFLTNTGSLEIIATDELSLTSANITWNSANNLTLTSANLMFLNSGTIDSQGTGDITLQNSGASSGSLGILVFRSTITSVSGDITINGRATGLASEVGAGVRVGGSTISTTGAGANAGNISITGSWEGTTGAALGGGFPNVGPGGILINDGGVGGANTNITSVDGDISLTGTLPNITGSRGSGIIVGSRNARDNLIVNSTGSGDMTLRGLSPTGDDIFVVQATGGIGPGASTLTVGSATSTGNITLVSDEFKPIDTAPFETNLFDTNNVSYQSQGIMTVSPNDDTLDIRVGTFADTSGFGAADMVIEEAAFDGVNQIFQSGFSAINIGDTDSGSGTISIGDLTINDDLSGFGGTVETDGTVTHNGNGQVLTAITGNVGGVNFATFDDNPPADPPADPPANNDPPPANNNENVVETPDAVEQQQVLGQVDNIARLAQQNSGPASNLFEAQTPPPYRPLISRVKVPDVLVPGVDSQDLLNRARDVRKSQFEPMAAARNARLAELQTARERLGLQEAEEQVVLAALAKEKAQKEYQEIVAKKEQEALVRQKELQQKREAEVAQLRAAEAERIALQKELDQKAVEQAAAFRAEKQKQLDEAAALYTKNLKEQGEAYAKAEKESYEKKMAPILSKIKAENEKAAAKRQARIDAMNAEIAANKEKLKAIEGEKKVEQEAYAAAQKQREEEQNAYAAKVEAEQKKFKKANEEAEAQKAAVAAAAARAAELKKQAEAARYAKEVEHKNRMQSDPNYAVKQNGIKDVLKTCGGCSQVEAERIYENEVAPVQFLQDKKKLADFQKWAGAEVYTQLARGDTKALYKAVNTFRELNKSKSVQQLLQDADKSRARELANNKVYQQKVAEIEKAKSAQLEKFRADRNAHEAQMKKAAERSAELKELGFSSEAEFEADQRKQTEAARAAALEAELAAIKEKQRKSSEEVEKRRAQQKIEEKEKFAAELEAIAEKDRAAKIAAKNHEAKIAAKKLKEAQQKELDKKIAEKEKAKELRKTYQDESNKLHGEVAKLEREKAEVLAERERALNEDDNAWNAFTEAKKAQALAEAELPIIEDSLKHDSARLDRAKKVLAEEGPRLKEMLYEFGLENKATELGLMIGAELGDAAYPGIGEAVGLVGMIYSGWRSSEQQKKMEALVTKVSNAMSTRTHATKRLAYAQANADRIRKEASGEPLRQAKAHFENTRQIASSSKAKAKAIDDQIAFKKNSIKRAEEAKWRNIKKAKKLELELSAEQQSTKAGQQSSVESEKKSEYMDLAQAS